MAEQRRHGTRRLKRSKPQDVSLRRWARDNATAPESDLHQAARGWLLGKHIQLYDGRRAGH